MNASMYGILVYIARYWFILLAAVIVVRAFLVSLQEYRYVAHLRSEIGGAGAAARLVLMSDPKQKYEVGMEYPIWKESQVGRARSNDICLRNRSIRPNHARMDMDEYGLRIRVRKEAFVAVDGVQVEGEAFARDGEQIQLGDLVFQLRIGGEMIEEE